MGASLSLTLAYHYAYSGDVLRKNTIPPSRGARCPCKKFFYSKVEEEDEELADLKKTIYLSG